MSDTQLRVAFDEGAVRRAIDDRYAEAIRALQTISRYVNGHGASAVGENGGSGATSGGKRRDLVLSVLRDHGGFMSVAAIHEKLPEIEIKHIRDVLYAKSARDFFDKHKNGNGVEFRAKPAPLGG